MIWPILEALAEIKKWFHSFFGRNENKKICFWNLLTFKVEFDGKLDEEKTDEVPNQYVLVTYDLEDPKKGILNYGNFNGPLAKTSNGMPDIK